MQLSSRTLTHHTNCYSEMQRMRRIKGVVIQLKNYNSNFGQDLNHLTIRNLLGFLSWCPIDLTYWLLYYCFNGPICLLSDGKEQPINSKRPPGEMRKKTATKQKYDDSKWGDCSNSKTQVKQFTFLILSRYLSPSSLDVEELKITATMLPSKGQKKTAAKRQLSDNSKMTFCKA